ncbi:MAG: hypothetical protein J6Z46_09000 [Lachnospiraceae bacterium]|nr:hypothetical protein [Lachnospiraceae bacterium]
MNRVLGKVFFCIVIFFGTILFVKLETEIIKEEFLSLRDTDESLEDWD